MLMSVLCGAVAGAPVQADTIYVWTDSAKNGPGTAWTNAWRHIQMAVDAAAPGDTVLVTNGVYDAWGLVTPDQGLTNRVCITKSITVRSVNGPEHTSIVGLGPVGIGAIRCVYMSAGTLDGFTLTNGFTMSSGDSRYDRSGGGLFIKGSSTVTNCTVTGCFGYYRGGGAYLYQGGTMNGCVVTNCSSDDYGGGAYLENGGTMNGCTIAGNWVNGLGDGYGDGGGVHISDAGTLNNCTIAGNRSIRNASGSGLAGGVACSWGGTLNGCTIRNNVADQYGGGFYMNSGGQMNSCTIEGNVAANLGGGGVMDSGTINNSTIRNNRAYSGGGVRILNAAAVVGSLVYSNTAANAGGGVLFYYGGHLRSSTVAANSAGSSGGGFYGTTGTVENCIVYGNSSSDRGGSGYTIRYSCSPGLSGNGNIGDDPQFANAAGNNYRLVSASPCIGAGTNATWMNNAKDLDGRPRIIGTTVDMGAYEFPSPYVVITTTLTSVPPAQTTIVLSGSNNNYVLGPMRYTNEMTGASGVFASTATWSTPAIGLAYGPNVLTVTGTNSEGVASSDSITVTRQMVAPGNALDFDGTDDYAGIPHTSIGNPSGDFTVECWVMLGTSAGSGTANVISKHKNEGGSSRSGYSLEYSYGNNRLQAVLGSTSGWTTLAGGTWNAFEWHHVALVYDAGTTMLTLYDNGVMQDSKPRSAPLYNTNDLYLGGSQHYGNYLDGRMDEARIWNVARSESEIRDDMHRQLSGGENGLVAYYTFNQSVTATLADFSTNHMDGALANGPTWTNSTVPCAVASAGRTNLRGAWIAQTNSLASSILSISKAAVSGVNYRAFGHDNGDMTWNVSDCPASIDWRLARAWQVEGTGALTGSVSFDCSGISFMFQDLAHVRLLVDADGVFDNATVVTGTYSANRFSVDGQSIPTGGYYTIGELALKSIHATAGENGSISPAGTVWVGYGESASFAITPSNYWHVADVTTNDAAVGAVTAFTWTNVIVDGTIHADFAADLAAHGTPHWWLASFGLTNSGESFNEAETNDTDGDTFTAGDEYIADTIPTNGGSFFCIKNITGASPIAVYFDSSASRVYTMQGSADLIHESWSNVPGAGPRLGVEGADSLQDTNQPPRGSFYRVGVQFP